MSKGTDWTSIEGHYRAGQRALRDIGAEFAITEGAIRARAKKLGWTRNAADTKRRMVADRMAGVTQEVSQDVMRNIQTAAEEDAKDMQTGLDIYRNVLQAMRAAAETVVDAKDAKVITEATEKAINGIRTIRGLDEPEHDDAITVDFPDAE